MTRTKSLPEGVVRPSRAWLVLSSMIGTLVLICLVTASGAFAFVDISERQSKLTIAVDDSFERIRWDGERTPSMVYLETNPSLTSPQITQNYGSHSKDDSRVYASVQDGVLTFTPASHPQTEWGVLEITLPESHERDLVVDMGSSGVRVGGTYRNLTLASSNAVIFGAVAVEELSATVDGGALDIQGSAKSISVDARNATAELTFASTTGEISLDQDGGWVDLRLKDAPSSLTADVLSGETAIFLDPKFSFKVTGNTERPQWGEKPPSDPKGKPVTVTGDGKVTIVPLNEELKDNLGWCEPERRSPSGECPSHREEGQ